jgi:hypothetical protein
VPPSDIGGHGGAGRQGGSATTRVLGCNCHL